MANKILLIEDDPFLSSLLGNRLTKEGFEVITARTSAEASKSMKSANPDLILLDIILPGKSGFEILEEAKIDPQASRAPVIIISNLGQETDIERGKELGVVDYIVKARTTIDDLVAKIKNFLK